MRRAFLALLAMVILWGREAAIGTAVYAVHDLRLQHLPWRVWAASEWARGHLPLWCDGVGNGFPLTADGQTGTFYPLTMLLFVALPPGLALDWAVLLHIWIAGAGTWLLAKALGRSDAAAFFAAVAFAFSGFLATHATYLGMQNAVAWFPWVLWALHRERRVALAVTTFLLLAAGHVEAAAFALLAVGACAVAWRRSPLYVFPGVLLAAPQLCATLELVGESTRAGGVSAAFAGVGSLPPQEIVNAVLPKLFGFDRPVDVVESYYQRGPDYWGQGVNHWEMAFYLGVPVAFLAFSTLRDRTVRLWWAIAAAALVLMLGDHTPLWPLVRHLPGLDHLRFPVRFSFVLTLAMAMLAAKGFEDPPRARWALGTAAVGAVALVMGHLAIGPSLEHALTEWFARKTPTAFDPTSLQAFLEPGAEHVTSRVEHILASLRHSTRLTSPEAFVPILALLALARPRWATVVLALDLFWFGASYTGTVPPLALPSHAEEGRSTVVDRRQDPALDDDLLSANLGLLAGTRDVIVPSPLLLPRNELFLAKVGLDVGDKGEAKVTRLVAHRELVDLMGIRWLRSVHELPGFTLRERGTVNVYENESAMSSAFVVGCVQVSDDVDGLQPRRWALVDAPVGVPLCRDSVAVPARVIRPREGVVLVHAEAERASLLVLTDTFYPGWEATIDGVAAPIVRADSTFRGVVVTAGTHDVELHYRPRWLAWSLLASAVGVVAIARTIHGAKTSG